MTLTLSLELGRELVRLTMERACEIGRLTMERESEIDRLTMERAIPGTVALLLTDFTIACSREYQRVGLFYIS